MLRVKTAPEGKDGARTRDFLALPALFVIALVEVQMSTGVWRVVYPLLAISLLSPFAQKLWAALLVARILVVSVVRWPLPEHLVSADFFAVRIVFLWILLARGTLLSTNRLVRILANRLPPHTRALSRLLLATAILIALYVTFFTVLRPHVLLLFAAFLAYVAKRIPRPLSKERKGIRTGPLEIGLAVASTFVFLALFELLMRLLPPAAAVGNLRPHPRALFCLAENTQVADDRSEFETTYYVISDQGFRDRHYGKKDKSAYRVLCVGDSFTMGAGVDPDDTYVKVLETLLAERIRSKRIEVINGGSGGYGVWQELIMLKERGFPLEPDLVILQLFPVNDLRDALARESKVLRSYDRNYQKRMQEYRKERDRTITKALCARSAAFAFVYGRCARSMPRVVRRLRSPFRKPVLPFPPSEVDRLPALESNLRTYYPELDEAWKLMEESIRRMATECQERGVGFLVFSAPGSHEVYPHIFQKLTRNPAIYDVNKSTRLAKELCEENALDFVELLPRFIQQRDRGDGLYYEIDGHWKAAGHRLCAEILCEHLLKTYLRELVPPSDERTEG